MASEVDICNIALSNIRAKTINSLNENSLQAQNCKLFYPILRDQLLEDTPWQFAHKSKPLSLTTLVNFNWRYVYQYPIDCIRINKLMIDYEGIRDETFGSTRKVQYEVMNIDDMKVIVSDQQCLHIDYRAKITDVNLFSNLFRMTLSHLLASEIAIPIIGAEMGRQLRSDNYQIYETYLNSAIGSNNNERHIAVPESEFITTQGTDNTRWERWPNG